jgi:DNA-binding HxlR family transcriptional regulator
VSIARKKVFDCPIERALFVISSRWKPRIIWRLRQGPVRFTDILTSVNGMSDRMLRLHLKELQEDGVVKRSSDASGWELTARGVELEPSLQALFDWGVVGGEPHFQNMHQASIPQLSTDKLHDDRTS